MEVVRRQVFEPDEGPRPVLSAAGIERVVTAVRTAVTQGRMEMRLRLHPESLGDVQVHVRWEGGVLTARLEAATPTARDALEGGLHLLRDALQEQGVPVERLQVGLRLDLGGQAQGHTLSRQADGRPDGPPTPVRGVTESVTTTVPPAGRLDVRV
ncbi:MAG TPA: flagellar hook-length control protein FliK [Candidatus Methylomirabilis sp.]|nr:flagellar hook-length control protein FliK [Candidatus Methylomirabilis sp.]